jgi:hypothetical protein
LSSARREERSDKLKSKDCGKKRDSRHFVHQPIQNKLYQKKKKKAEEGEKEWIMKGI